MEGMPVCLLKICSELQLHEDETSGFSVFQNIKDTILKITVKSSNLLCAYVSFSIIPFLYCGKKISLLSKQNTTI